MIYRLTNNSTNNPDLDTSDNEIFNSSPTHPTDESDSEHDFYVPNEEITNELQVYFEERCEKGHVSTLFTYIYIYIYILISIRLILYLVGKAICISILL